MNTSYNAALIQARGGTKLFPLKAGLLFASLTKSFLTDKRFEGIVNFRI